LKATLLWLWGLGAVGCAASHSSDTTVVVTPASAAAGTASATVEAPAPSGAVAPADDKTMVVKVGDTTIRYVIGSAEATAAVMKGIRHARASAVACYEGGAAKNRALRGKMVVQVVLDPAGTVRSARNAGSTLTDPDVVDCVVRAFRAASFAELDGHCTGDVEVTEPLTFAPVP
jgi:hypothetical protein